MLMFINSLTNTLFRSSKIGRLEEKPSPHSTLYSFILLYSNFHCKKKVNNCWSKLKKTVVILMKIQVVLKTKLSKINSDIYKVSPSDFCFSLLHSSLYMQLEASNIYFTLLLSTSWRWWTSTVSIFAYYIFFHLKRCPLSCYLSLLKERNFIFLCFRQTYMTREEDSWCIKTLEFATEEATCLNVRWRQQGLENFY